MSWLMKAVFLLAVLLTGCEHMRRQVPDTRIYLGHGQRIEANAITRRTNNGTPLDRFICIEPYLLVCDRFGSVFLCECE